MRKGLLILMLFTLALVAFAGCNNTPAEIIDASNINNNTSEANATATTTNASNTSNELTIATWRESTFLETAARRFEELHDGRYTITINMYDDHASYAQAINTALMGGRGEDIIDVTRIPWQRLANVDRLVDLTDKIDFAPGEFYQGVLDAYLHGGRRYVIPLSFAFAAFCFNFTGVVSPESRPSQLNIETLIALVEAYPGNQLWLSGSGLNSTTLALMLFTLDFDQYIDLMNRQANIDNENFITLLENVQSLGESLELYPLSENALFLEDMLYGPAMSMNGLMDYTYMVLMTNDRGEARFDSIGFTPAINANSTNQDLATKFITFLLSHEMQASPELMFNPVHRAATTEMATLLLESIRAGGYAAAGFDLENNITAFNRLAENLSVSNTSDPFITGFVMDEMTRFFDGEVTAQQAATNLQGRLTTYLNE